jgi:hypothetical protein
VKEKRKRIGRKLTTIALAFMMMIVTMMPSVALAENTNYGGGI